MLYPGIASDILKTMKFYDTRPNILPQAEKLLFMVYLAEYSTEEQAFNQMQEFTQMNNQDRHQLVESANPEWIDITAEIWLSQPW